MGNSVINKSREISATSLWRASAVCLLAAMFYLYEFCLQVSPGVMTNELMRAYNVGAMGLGTISAFYYYAYTPMQLPAGVLYDRFGPRKLIPFATLVCALGALFFSTTDSVVMASYGRFMMGFGSAFSFIGTLVLISRWFPSKYFAVLAGIAQLMSSVGAVFGEAPLAAAIDHFGWRHSMVFLAVVGIFLALAVWLVVRDFPEGHAPISSQKRRSKQSIKGLARVLQSQQTWCIAAYSFCIWAPIAVFAALWGVPFIAELYNRSTTLASSAISMVWIGIGVGSPLLGWLSEKLEIRCPLLGLVAMIGLFSTLTLIYAPDLPFVVMYALLFLLGIAASGQSLSFAVIKDVTDPKHMGTAVGFNNMAVVAGGAFFQPLVGYLLHLFWQGAVINGTRYYSVFTYRKALWILPLCYLGAAIISWYFIKETQCRQSYNHNVPIDEAELQTIG